MAAVPSRAQLDILSDTSSDDDHCSHDSFDTSDSALRHLAVPDVQNRRSSATSNSAIESLIAGIENLQIDPEAHEPSRVDEEQTWDGDSKQQYRRRLSRPVIASNTFEVLETVPENEPQRTPTSKPISDSIKELQRPQLPAPGERFSDHPLVQLARKGIPSAKEQLAQHRNGWFQGILSTKIPIGPPASVSDANPKFKQIHFGLNILPVQDNSENKDPSETTNPSFDILVTPLAPGEELRVDDSEVLGKGSMTLAKPAHDHLALVMELEAPSLDEARLPSTATNLANNKERRVDTLPSRQPLKTIPRIEDSVEALDKLEEQLEAFDEAAHFRQLASPGAPDAETRSTMQSLSVANTHVKRSTTPQPKRTTPVKTGSASSVRIKATSEPRRSVRKSASMIFLDSPKLKSEDKPLAQAPARKPSVKGIASLLPPKQPPKSTKKPTIPTFELPGDEVARKLKEKREARASMQAAVEQATKPTVSSLRRAKSAKAPTRPNFELPGEAISRRKREEREAQLRAQEEEERKRREFKARPIRSGLAPSTFPRETVASRARQNKMQMTENSAHPSPNKQSPMMMNSTARSPLSRTNNQATLPRGRGLHPEPLGLQPSRATSSSSTVGSGSAQRSSMSTEDVQQQRLRGQEIYKRDNSWSGEREREKREREALAKLAREEAAERSRQQSREWAAKQARKRMTITSVRDLMT
ncbi:hypothetical protein GGR53DRAFT_204079 [Hypoxylon sp. FL1150]|nr:hypothetical protein GGR53DRAFT_204079 [Hypoxylon sp. FL1150]